MLSGSKKELNELRALKTCMKNCLPLVKNIVYERYFLSMLNVEIPRLPSIKPLKNNDEYWNYIGKFKETDKASPFLINQRLENRSLLVYRETSIVLKTK